MRLIDVDAFGGIVKEGGMIDEHATVVARNAMLAMPTVDAVPVIRCKDCKHWACDDSESYCDELGIFNTDMNSYCSYAKRKEE